jgi:cystathionine beta-lyase
VALTDERDHPAAISGPVSRSTCVVASSFVTQDIDHLRSVAGAKWSRHGDCLGAWVAEMDFGTAPVVQDAMRKMVDDGFFGYMPAGWVERMKDATATWYGREYDWQIPAERIKVLPDVLKGLEFTVTEFSRPGSKVIVSTPAYMPFLIFPKLLGREHIEVPSILEGGEWRLDLDGIEKAFQDGGGVLILCNPWNPVGRVMRRDELDAVSQLVARYDGRVFSDEIHAPITYSGNQHIPYASINEAAANHTITAVSASKAFNLPGLKCAQLIISNDADNKKWSEIGFLAEHGASTIGVLANAVAFESGKPWLDDVLGYLDENRTLLKDLLAKHLPEVGYDVPQGTYLAWLDFSAYGHLPSDIDSFFRTNAKVAITNGAACGEVGKGRVRFNFAMARELMEQSIEQIAKAVNA